MKTADFPLILELGNLLVFAILSVALLFSWRRRQRIDATALSKIGSLKAGSAEIEGRAHSCHQLVSPLTGKPCAYFFLTVTEQVDELNDQQQSQTKWVPRLTSSSSLVPFYVEDDSGAVLVDPLFITAQVSTKFSLSGQPMRWTENERLLASRAGVPLGWFDGQRMFQIEELRIDEGARVFAMGELAAGDYPIRNRRLAEHAAGVAGIRQLAAEAHQLPLVGKVAGAVADRMAANLIRLEMTPAELKPPTSATAVRLLAKGSGAVFRATEKTELWLTNASKAETSAAMKSSGNRGAWILVVSGLISLWFFFLRKP